MEFAIYLALAIIMTASLHTAISTKKIEAILTRMEREKARKEWNVGGRKNTELSDESGFPRDFH